MRGLFEYIKALLGVVGFFVGLALAIGTIFGIAVWAGFAVFRFLGVPLS